MKNIKWIQSDYKDSVQYHSFPASIASALIAQNIDMDIVDIMGFSGFAFRFDVQIELCPSAMSVFDWHELAWGMDNCDLNYTKISRLWDEVDLRDKKRDKAKELIIEALDKGEVPIAWDLIIPEWSLITGYDEVKDAYTCVGPGKMIGELDANRLGQHTVEIMDVSIIHGIAKKKSKEQQLEDTIRWVVSHMRSEHWTDRPKYEQGNKGFDVYREYMIRTINGEITQSTHEDYYADITYGARLNAYRFLKRYGNDNPLLTDTANIYCKTAKLCKKLSQIFADESKIENTKRQKAVEILEMIIENEACCLLNFEKWLEVK